MDNDFWNPTRIDLDCIFGVFHQQDVCTSYKRRLGKIRDFGIYGSCFAFYRRQGYSIQNKIIARRAE